MNLDGFASNPNAGRSECYISWHMNNHCFAYSRCAVTSILPLIIVMPSCALRYKRTCEAGTKICMSLLAMPCVTHQGTQSLINKVLDSCGFLCFSCGLVSWAQKDVRRTLGLFRRTLPAAGGGGGAAPHYTATQCMNEYTNSIIHTLYQPLGDNSAGGCTYG